MNERIKTIRKEAQMNMASFAEKIGITSSAVSRIESGENNPKDQTIMLICREFNINEHWLRTGEGDMHADRDDVADAASELLGKTNPLYDMVVDIIKAYSELDEPSKKVINNLIDKIKSGEVKAS